jgi:DNA topoisomerase I
MSNNLIIVESYTKTKTIYKYLKDENHKYNVTFSQGHFCDLPKNELGININTWEGTYTTTKENILKNIRKYVKEADNIYIAADPDTEGEAIAYHIKNNIKDLLKKKNCYRIKFNEITKNAIITAINNPLDIDINLVKAQETRRFLDRIVGFKLSPLLWNKFNDKYLSVGRVQSVALLLCIEQLNLIKNHEIEKYWNLNGSFNYNDIILDCISIKIKDENILENILNILDIPTNKFKIEISQTNSSEYPSPPYSTTTLQQDAYNNLRYNSKKTMELAQKLYEKGYITYMRTDSVNISKEFKYKLQKYITNNYGSDNSVIRNFKNKIINSQEAHEAIRITNPNIINISNDDEITEYHDKLYNMIWKRTIASQMKEAIYTNINSIIKCVNNSHCNDYIFKCNKTFLTNRGFLIIYNKELEDYKTYYNKLNTKKNINVNIISFSLECDINQPKSLYNEITLIKKLEKEGIGRPSTYASIIDKLYIRKYVIKGKNPSKNVSINNLIKKHKKDIKIITKDIKTGGKNSDLLVPTDLGIKSIEYLNTIIPFLLNINFTAEMENALDKISIGEITKDNILQQFYDKIYPIINIHGNINNNFENKRKTGIIKSKYGYCYYHEKDNRYTNIEPYLSWKKKSVEQLENKEITFLGSLPKKLEDGMMLHIGKYGLYLKDNNNKNIKLDKKKWDSFI